MEFVDAQEGEVEVEEEGREEEGKEVEIRGSPGKHAYQDARKEETFTSP